MSGATDRPWRDGYGVRVQERARVVQTDMDKRHGALAANQGKHGVVVEFHQTRVGVLFDGASKPVRLAPRVLQVLELPDEDGGWGRGCRWHCYVDRMATPTDTALTSRERRLNEWTPTAVRDSPRAIAKCVLSVIGDVGSRVEVWNPEDQAWLPRDATDRVALLDEFRALAARGWSLYAAAHTRDGRRVGAYAEAMPHEDHSGQIPAPAQQTTTPAAGHDDAWSALFSRTMDSAGTTDGVTMQE